MRSWFAILALVAGCFEKTELLPVGPDLRAPRDASVEGDGGSPEDLAVQPDAGLEDLAVAVEDGAGGERDASRLDDLGPAADRPADLRSACVAPGAPILLGGECSSALAARLGRYALCSCQALLLTRRLISESFDSSSGGQPIYWGASVGGNAGIEANGGGEVGGALVGAGATGIRTSGTWSVAQTLRSGGPLSAQWSLATAHDAYVAGDVLGNVWVFGTLHVPSGANLGSQVRAKQVARESVTVAAPCDCGKVVDPVAEVAARASSNDNGRLSFDVRAIGQMVGDRTFDIPCGSFHVPAIVSTGDLDLRVHGRAALFVAGDVKVAKALRVALDSAAELDLVVAGELTVGDGGFGSTAAPGRVRIWSAAQTIKAGHGKIAGFLHAPQAILSGGDLSLSGGAVVRGVSSTGDLNLRYDRAILVGGRSCGKPDQPAVE